jgi:hypothetical protein
MKTYMEDIQEKNSNICKCGHSKGKHVYTGWCRHLECTHEDCSTCEICHGVGFVTAFQNGRDHATPCPRGCNYDPISCPITFGDR